MRANLFNADSKVKETRFETATAYSWKVSPKVQLEGAIDSEYSRLRQVGRDINTSRRFFFIKPRFDLRYDVSRRVQVRARVLRSISQLDFANFVSSFPNDDVRLNVILAGNPNLVPEKTWTFETTYEQRFSGRRDVVSLRGFYNLIDDHIDRIRIVPGVAGVGNIGRAKSYGAEAKAGLGLGWLGLTNASLDVTGTVQGSSVVDSFTRDRRRIQSLPNYKWSVGYRHDTGWHGLSYGATVTASGPYLASDIDFRHTISGRPDAAVYVEARPLGNVTFRLEGARLLQTRADRDRFQYVGERAAGVLLREELRRDLFDRSVKFIVRGAF